MSSYKEIDDRILEKATVLNFRHIYDKRIQVINTTVNIKTNEYSTVGYNP